MIEVNVIYVSRFVLILVEEVNVGIRERGMKLELRVLIVNFRNDGNKESFY